MNPAELDPGGWARISGLLDELLELPPMERATRLEQAGLDDAARRQIEALLRADEAAGGFLETAGSYHELVAPDDAADDGWIGDAARIGPWRIIRELGRGGMGSVFLAERADGHFEQRAALKVVKRGMDTDRILQRFRAERQILARLDHPRIARLLDGGMTADGLPYFAMEYVEGAPIVTYAAHGNLSRAERFRLLDEVCDAVEYAHRNRVVHRDLKPSNVLVTPEGHVKLVDFGIAKLLSTDGDGLTATGERVMTPEYAAPEQLRGEPVTTATDVYGLGLLLHELVTGRRFPSGRGARIGEADLEVILDTALCDEPRGRYASVEALREDLRRFLAREPVVARRPRVASRFHVRIATLAAGLAVAAAAWGVKATGRAAAPAEIVVAAPDTTRLGAGEGWIGDSLQRLIVEDLADAWKVEARAATAADAPAVGTRVWRDARGQLRMAILLPGAPGPEVPPGSLRELSRAAARHAVERLVPAADRHPTSTELREVGARDAEAWRQWRRARRAARMRVPERTRDLARDAIRRDPDFALPRLDLAFSYEWSDAARSEALDRAIALGDRAAGLSPVSRLTLDIARPLRVLDEPGMWRVIKAFEKLTMQGEDLLYLQARVVEMDAEAHLGLLERIAETWPRDAAAPKRLAAFFLGSREPHSLPQALRYGRAAVALAPHDMGARADLARALVLSGDVAAARAHLAVIGSSDPEEKQDAFAGEHSNRLFLLHMSLGEIEEGSIDARRLLLGAGVRHAEGQMALGSLELSRGAFEAGLEALDDAAAEYERLRMETAAARIHWERAWQAYNLGRYEDAMRSAGHVGRLKLAAGNAAQLPTLAAVLEHLAHMGQGSPTARGVTAAGLRGDLAKVSKGRDWVRWRDDLDVVVCHRFQDWRGVLEAYRRREGPVPPLTVTWYAADALERIGRADEAVRLFEQLTAHPQGWQHPYRRGQAWLRLAALRRKAGDTDGARAALEHLLKGWDHARRDLPEIREAERRLTQMNRTPAAVARRSE